MGSDITAVFNLVYDQTYDDVMKFVLSRTGDCNATSDILQDVYKSLFIRIRNKGSKDIDDFRGFLIVSASNALKKYYAVLGTQRANISFNSVADGEDGGSVVALKAIQALEYEMSAELTQIDEKLTAADLAEQVLDYLEAKGVAIKQLFVLHFFCGLTIKEAAHNTGMNQCDAVNIIYRTIKEMKRKFEI